jgi:hypothetical protein
MDIGLTYFLDTGRPLLQLWGRVPPQTTDLSPFGRELRPRRVRQRALGVSSIQTRGSLMAWECKHGLS